MKSYELKIQNWENIHFFLTLCCYQFATSLSPFLFAHCFHLRLFVQRITDHPVISTAFSQVSTVESFFSHAFRHTLLAISMWISPPLVSKKHHFQRVTDLRKKIWIFQKKTQMKQKLQKERDKVGFSTLSFFGTMSNRRFPMEQPQLNIFHVAILTHWGHSCWPGGTPAPVFWPHWETWEPNSVIDIWVEIQ